jgi:hypothetical protein
MSEEKRKPGRPKRTLSPNTPAFDVLTPKQQRFVAEMALSPEPKSQTQAVINAGYDVKDRHCAGVVGASLVSTPEVRSAIKELILAKYPDIHSDRLMWIQEAIQAPIGDRGMTWETKLKVLDQITKLFGDSAPTKHLRANLKDFLKLPGQG